MLGHDDFIFVLEFVVLLSVDCSSISIRDHLWHPNEHWAGELVLHEASGASEIRWGCQKSTKSTKLLMHEQQPCLKTIVRIPFTSVLGFPSTYECSHSIVLHFPTRACEREDKVLELSNKLWTIKVDVALGEKKVNPNSRVQAECLAQTAQNANVVPITTQKLLLLVFLIFLEKKIRNTCGFGMAQELVMQDQGHLYPLGVIGCEASAVMFAAAI